MQTNKETLLQMLANNEDDVETRLILADLLEETGQDDKAQRHRDWPASKRWLIEFLAKVNDTADDDEPFGYDRLLVLCSRVNELDDIKLFFDGYERLMWSIIENRDEFWKHWSIVSGVRVTESQLHRASYRCAC